MLRSILFIPNGNCITKYVRFFLLFLLLLFYACVRVRACVRVANRRFLIVPQSIFRGGIAKEFINTLLEVLAGGSHELLREEIGLSIYAMASADFEVFFQQTLPSYLVTCQGIDDQQRILLKNGFAVETVNRRYDSPLG